MIARFRILLPFKFSIPYTDRLEPFEVEQDGYKIKFYPPAPANVNPADLDPLSQKSLSGIAAALAPSQIIGVTEQLQINDMATMQANLLQIDFKGDDFDRREETATPSIEYLLAITNNFLARLRTLLLGFQIKPLSEDAFWRLQYLTDDEEELEPDQNFVRQRMSSSVTWSTIALEATVWTEVQQMPSNYTPPIWHTLLLDARNALPEIGSSIILTAAALEILIATSLDQLASHAFSQLTPSAAVPIELWNWVNKRKDPRTEPSVEEQFDSLLRLFVGKSLKDEKALWKVFMDLKSARNYFMHEGKALIASENKREATREDATQFVNTAKKIADWVESLLPPEFRIPKASGGSPIWKVGYKR